MLYASRLTGALTAEVDGIPDVRLGQAIWHVIYDVMLLNWLHHDVSPGRSVSHYLLISTGYISSDYPPVVANTMNCNASIETAKYPIRPSIHQSIKFISGNNVYQISNTHINTKAMLSQRWPRDAPYIWMLWKKFGSPSLGPRLLFPKLLMGFCCSRSY